MSNYPMDCGINSTYDLPWEESEQSECPICGSSVSVSSIDKHTLICDDDQCGNTIDTSASGLSTDW